MPKLQIGLVFKLQEQVYMNSVNGKRSGINENLQGSLKDLINPQGSINKPEFPFMNNEWLLQGICSI